MKAEQPILSICIPTYNRVEYLRQTLESIVSQDVFLNTNEVEVAISDNCSSDNTQDVVEQFLKKFPGKIIYNRNAENLVDGNMEKVLSIARGCYRKLNNDTLMFSPGCLEKMLAFVKENIKEKPVLFFLNNKSSKGCVCENLNDFLAKVSFGNTWIGSFGIWESDLNAIKDFSRYWQLRLPQTDVLFRIISGGKKVLINEEKLTMPMEGLRKGGYNVAEVFGKNYLFFVSEAKKNGYVSNKIYRREKRKILKNKIIPLYFDFNGDYEFDNQATGYFSFLMPFYKFDFYFYFYFLKVVGKYIKFRIKQIL